MTSPRDGKPEAGDITATVVPADEPEPTGLTATGARARPRSEETAFLPGDVVAGRYHIRRFIAFGGMGEVYEAEDQVLHEIVALKTIRADVADDEVAGERFKREILLARKVTHVNVCRIFDLGLHSSTGREPQMFLTMELLQGETLADRVRTARAFSVAEARPIVAQMVAALEAAHREGIVHRDLKSGNVMLCPAKEEGGPTRVVVTDFGLARGSDADPFSTSASGNVGMMGSPAYMAPEQVEGGEITRAADIYALGVVMFEMLTGHVPFIADTAMACAVKRLKEPAPSPRKYLPELGDEWEKTILRCLEREPGGRYARVGDVMLALDGNEPALATTMARPVSVRLVPAPEAAAEEPAPVPPAPRTRWWVAAGLVLAAGLAGGWQLLHRRPAAVAVAGADKVGARRAIAVLGFKNLARRDDVAWLSTALGEMLTTEMGSGGELRTIPGESIARMKKELALDDAESFAPDTLARIQRNLGADFVVLGSYVPLGDRFRLDVRLQDTTTGETLLQVADTGTEAELAALVQRSGAQLRQRLRMTKMDDAEQAIVNASLPHNPEAARLYSQGLAQLRIFSGARARELLEHAVQIEPAFPQAHTALSEALAYLGYEEQARQEAKKAVDLSGGLPEAQRLRVEGHYHTIAGDAPRAAAAYGRLFELEPDSVEWGMRLASAQFGAGDDAEAARTVARLRAIPDAEDDPRVYMVLMQAALMNQAFEEVRENAARLAASGEARGALSLVSEAKHSDAVALWFEGELGTALERADEARQLSFRLGDRDGVAAAATTKAFILTEQGDYAEAARVAQLALDAAAEVGARRRIWLAEHVRARVGLFGGDLAVARRHYDASREAAIEAGSKYGEALAMLGTAVTLAAQGELDKAESIYTRMNIGFKLFAPKYNLSFLRYFRGNLELAQGDLAAARAAEEEALELSKKFGERVQGERAQSSLGMVALREGKLEEAAAHGRAAAEDAQALGLGDDLETARAVEARVLAAQGKRAEAERKLAEAETAGAHTQNIFVRLDLALLRGEVALVEGGAAGGKRAVEAIEPALAEADTKGYVGAALELRLALVSALRAARRQGDAARELAKVTAESDRLGYDDVKRRARALAK